MNNILGINLYDCKSAADIDFINQGAIAEQVVGQLLRTIDSYYIEPKLYYWQRNHPGSNAEIDYLIWNSAWIVISGSFVMIYNCSNSSSHIRELGATPVIVR